MYLISVDQDQDHRKERDLHPFLTETTVSETNRNTVANVKLVRCLRKILGCRIVLGVGIHEAVVVLLAARFLLATHDQSILDPGPSDNHPHISSLTLVAIPVFVECR